MKLNNDGTDEPICKAETEIQTQRTNTWAPRRVRVTDELGGWNGQIYTALYNTDN